MNLLFRVLNLQNVSNYFKILISCKKYAVEQKPIFMDFCGLKKDYIVKIINYNGF